MADKPVSSTPTPTDSQGRVSENKHDRRAATNPDPEQAAQHRENARPAQEQRRWQEQDR
jgi:hypothetical protein